MGKLYRRGTTWWADYQHRQHGRVRVSLRTEDVKVARERLRLAELAETDPAAHREARTLAAAIGYMIDTASSDRSEATRAFYRQKAGHLARLLGSAKDVATLRRSDVLDFAHARLAEGAHRHTVGKELIALRRVLTAEHERSALPVHPRDVIPRWKMEYVPKDRHLTPDDFRRVLEKAPAARRLWLMVAVYTGANLGELTRLEWSHVDLRTGQIRIPGTKAKNRHRRVPIPAPLRPWLADAAKRRGLMFAPWSNVRRDLAQYAEAARVPSFTPNDLRRTYASWLVQAGVPHLTVSHLMGHSSTRMVEAVYGRLTAGVYTAAVANLPGCDAGVSHGGADLARGGVGVTGSAATTARIQRKSGAQGRS